MEWIPFDRLLSFLIDKLALWNGAGNNSVGIYELSILNTCMPQTLNLLGSIRKLRLDLS